jgi:hypothetical protein
MSEEKKTILNRREFLRGASLLTAGGVLAACAPSTPAPTAAPQEEGGEEQPAAEAPAAEAPAAEAPAPEGATIQYWVNWGGSYAGTVWDKLKETDEFKELIGDNTLELKGSAGGEVTLTAVAAGSPPEAYSGDEVLDYMARGVCNPIEDWVATSSFVKKERFLEGNWENGFWQGVQYGVPANECFLRFGLNYNAQMVEEAGLDPDSPPVTWDDCLTWHEALTQFDDAGNLLQIGLDPYDAMGGSLACVDGFFPATSWNWQWFNEDTGEFDLDNEKMIEAFEVMGEFYRIVGPDNMVAMRQVEGQGDWGGSMNAEVQAMIIEGYWSPGERTIAKPEVTKHNRVTWAPVPEERRGTKFQGTGGHYVITFQEAKHPEVMFQVAEFLSTKVACDIIFENVGWLPAVKDYIETVDPSVFTGLDFYFKSIDEATEWHAPARCPITGFAQNQFGELREAVYREKMTATEAAAEFQKRCDSEYEALSF